MRRSDRLALVVGSLLVLAALLWAGLRISALFEDVNRPPLRAITREEMGAMGLEALSPPLVVGLVGLAAVGVSIRHRVRELRAVAPLRPVLVAVGLAAVVYGTASLTGGWLGTPAWWYVEGASGSLEGMTTDTRWTVYARRPGREWISGGVVAVGLALVAVGGWPRRRREVAS